MTMDPTQWLRESVDRHEEGRRIHLPLEAHHLEEFDRLPRDPVKHWDALAALLIDLGEQVPMPHDLHLFGRLRLGEVSAEQPPVPPIDPSELAATRRSETEDQETPSVFILSSPDGDDIRDPTQYGYWVPLETQYIDLAAAAVTGVESDGVRDLDVLTWFAAELRSVATHAATRATPGSARRV